MELGEKDEVDECVNNVLCMLQQIQGEQGEEFKWLGFREGIDDNIMKRGDWWKYSTEEAIIIVVKIEFQVAILWLYEYQNLIKTSGLWKFKIPKSEDKLKDKQKWAQGTYHHISHYKYEKWNSKIAKNGFLLAYQNNNTTLLFRQR